MPSYTRGKTRDITTFVKLSATQEVYYGFNTKDLGALPGISNADLVADLGHLAALPTGAIVFIRSTSPKPPRFRKTLVANPTVDQQGSVSTFGAVTFVNTALNNGWQLAKRGNAVTISNNSRTIGAGAQLSNNSIVITPMNATDFNTYATELGLLAPGSISNTERERCVFGASRPQAGVASKDLGALGTITKPFSTATNVANNNWTVLQTELV